MNNHEELLLITAQRIFEESTFAFVDMPDDPHHLFSEVSPMIFQIDFNGPYSGMICMRILPPLASMLADNMLGEDDEEEDPVSRNNDAMGELLNILCGNLLPLIAGPQEEFALSSPRKISDGEFDAILRIKSDWPMVRSGFIVEGHPVDFMLSMECPGVTA
jgi:hypothetical protein